MATHETTASIHTLHQPKAQTPAERARAYRLRKKGGLQNASQNVEVTAVKQSRVPEIGALRGQTVTPSRSLAQVLLIGTSLGLAVVGITMNGWFAHSLGSSVIAGWLFAAIGVAADLVALSVPSAAASLWQTRQRASAVAGWLVWVLTFAFAVTAGIGFASVNITDVTASRASRVTPAVTNAQAAVADAVAARDRECGVVGKNCRAREDVVNERRRALDVAMKTVEQAADPQTEAASRIVAWVTVGLLQPNGNDVAMLRLVLFALLPQLGGILLMVGKGSTQMKKREKNI